MKKLAKTFVITALTFILYADILHSKETNGLVILITDFGTKDFYVGAVKGVIYSIYPEVRIDDISHNVSSFEVAEGAYTLQKAAAEFPKGTVFVAVVDPGVGTERKPVALKTKDGKFFVGPDNGLFSVVMDSLGIDVIYEISNPHVMRKGRLSSTFHGKDIFGPCAAHLASGFPIELVGPVLKDYVRLKARSPVVQKDTIIGNVVTIDKYGNVITNVQEELLRKIEIGRGDLVILKIKDVEMRAKYVKAYADVPTGEYLCLIGSTGAFEVAINMGNLAQKIGVKRGDSISIRRILQTKRGEKL